jgi:hypothetical protein
LDKLKSSEFNIINNLSDAGTPNRKLNSTILGESVQSASSSAAAAAEANAINSSPNVSATIIEDMNNNSLNLSHVIDTQGFHSGKVFLHWESKKFSLHDLTNSLSKYEMHILDYYRYTKNIQNIEFIFTLNFKMTFIYLGISLIFCQICA